MADVLVTYTDKVDSSAPAATGIVNAADMNMLKNAANAKQAKTEATFASVIGKSGSAFQASEGVDGQFGIRFDNLTWQLKTAGVWSEPVGFAGAAGAAGADGQDFPFIKVSTLPPTEEQIGGALYGVTGV